ncbi:MAG: hypothetical protein IJ583_03195 [Firmicutes bacterium]|nr:hypothetical protein [Bacillota bacterium]
MEQDISKFTAKDTVFRNLFGDKKYTAMLYSALHNGEIVSPEDIEIITLEEILMASLYNDVGFMVKGKIIILVECQSTWSENIIIRLIMYLAETYYRYYRKTKQSLYSTTKVDFPKPELYLIYTGSRKITKEYISLSDSFLNGEKCDIDIRVKVITDGSKGDIVNQYIAFTRILNEQVSKYGRTRKAAAETIRICCNDEILKEYLKNKESEVSSIMLNMFDVDTELNIFFDTEKRVARAEGLAAGKAEGLAAGKAEGLAAGKAEGKRENAISVALKMLRKNKYDLNEIADCSGLSLEEVSALSKENNMQLV